MKLEGKVAVVTGGASGIGRGIAEELVARGAKVVIADIEQGALDMAAAEIGATGIHCDVSDFASVKALADETVRQFGKVDIIVNNAGVGSVAFIENMTIDDWKWMLGVNLWGTIHGIQAFLPLLLANPDGGHIAATTSIGGFTTMPMLAPYSVSKYGVVAAMEGLKLEMGAAGHNIGVTILAPGPITSNIHKSQRNRPDRENAGGFVDVKLDDIANPYEGGVPWKPARFAGQVLADAMEANRLYVCTHPEMLSEVFERQNRIRETFLLPI